MKASDFRIGNLVCEPIHKLPFYIGLEDIADLLFDRPKRFEPIPLTEEWLLRFGFKLDREGDDYNYYTLEGFDSLSDYGDQGVSLPKNDKGYSHIYCGYYRNEIDFEFVHQLQNLYFALTNEELKEE